MDLFGLRALPFLTRRNYYYELRQLLVWSVLAGVVEGQFASVVVSKTFNGSERLIAIATATPIAAMTFSLIWGMLCVGRPKIRLAIIFAAGTTLCAGLVGAIPTSQTGAIWFICQMAAAQVLMAGVVTVRSALWKSNYPRFARGQIAARLQGVRFVVAVATVLAAAAICDADPTSYRYIYPGAALFGLVGTWLLTRIHIRGERNELRRYGRSPVEEFQRSGLVEPFSLTALLSPGHVVGHMVRVLRKDRRFTQYRGAQLLTGVANLMTIPVVVAVVTRDLQMSDKWAFWISTGLIVAIPRLVMLAGLSRWGRLFDRLGVVRVRVLNVICWTMSLVLGCAATIVTVHSESLGPGFLVLAVVLFALRGLLTGLAYGGAALAWTLGHLHFARPDEAEVYMGIHVSLTGVRGLIAPLLGMWIWHCIGWPVWLIAIALSLCSFFMFSAMAREERRVGMPTAPGDAV